MEQRFDLFGDPIPDNWGKRGRPQHIATTENINKVTMLVALGWNNERVATALDITLPTLRKHYFSLIKRLRETARDRLDAAFAMHIWKEVQTGSVAAMRMWQLFLDRNDAMRAEADLGAPDEKPEIGRVGKKVLNAQLALDADDDLSAELDREAAGEYDARH